MRLLRKCLFVIVNTWAEGRGPGARDGGPRDGGPRAGGRRPGAGGRCFRYRLTTLIYEYSNFKFIIITGSFNFSSLHEFNFGLIRFSLRKTEAAEYLTGEVESVFRKKEHA